MNTDMYNSQSKLKVDLFSGYSATLSSILAWKVPWTKAPGGHSPWGHKQLDMTKQLSMLATLKNHKPLYLL